MSRDNVQNKIVFSGLSGSTLKLIACCSMLSDHIGVALYPEEAGLRMIGRIAFPLFCFLLVEGFHHTSNRKKYFLRLIIFALISEIPFDLGFNGQLIYLGHQNAFFTLAIGFLVMWIAEQSRRWIVLIALTAGACVFNTFIHADYTYLGILIIIIFYAFRQLRTVKLIAFTLANSAFQFGSVQFCAVLALIPIWFYNGRKGFALKYVFYAFYPVHLLILGIIRTTTLQL